MKVVETGNMLAYSNHLTHSLLSDKLSPITQRRKQKNVF